MLGYVKSIIFSWETALVSFSLQPGRLLWQHEADVAMSEIVYASQNWYILNTLHNNWRIFM